MAQAAHSQSTFIFESNPKTFAPFDLGCAKAISLAEETGFLLGASGDLGETGNESWDEIRSMNLAPNLEKMHYVGHAITPASKAVRFNARFFYTWVHEMSGTLGGSGELSDLAFLSLRDALRLPMVDVTEFMLEEMILREQTDFATPTTYPFFGYRKGRQYQRYT